MPSILSTKKLLLNQRELLLNAGLSFVEYDSIVIKNVAFTLPQNVENVIITSQNAAKAYCQSESINKLRTSPVEDDIQQSENLRQAQGDKSKFFVVGEKTASLLIEKGRKVLKIAQNGAELGHFIAKNYKNETFHYFCGNLRRDELPTILKASNVVCNEVIVYETHSNEQSFDQVFDGVLFYSPSGVDAFAKANPLSLPLKEEKEGCIAFCIGETTADEARKHTDQVIVANDTTIESVIAKAVTILKQKIMSPRAQSRG